MEDGLRGMYMALGIFIFVSAMVLLFIFQNDFENTCRNVMEEINGGYIW